MPETITLIELDPNHKALRRNSTQRNSTWLATPHESTVLCVSSLQAGLPSALAWYHGELAFALVGFMVMVCSINFWRRPLAGWRRDMDLVVAKVGAACQIYSSFFRPQQSQIVFLALALIGLLLYLRAALLWNEGKRCWVGVHFVFHSCFALANLALLGEYLYTYS